MQPTPFARRGARAARTGLAALLFTLVACGQDAPKAEPERRGAPPPPTAAASGAAAKVECTRAHVDDPETANVFKAKVAGFCLDPADGGEAMGEGAKAPLEKMCDLFDGECKVYEDHGVKRVARARYVSEAGGAATVDVYASRFDAPESAYAMFTKRVVGDGDPADPATPKPAPGGDVAAIGIGNAYVAAGATLFEITYSDDRASPPEIEKASRPVLEALAKELGGAAGKLPVAALELPEAGRLPLGVRYLKDEVVRGVKGTGPGAVGYYADGGKRWRLAIIEAADEAAAKKVIDAFAAAKGAKKDASGVTLDVADGGVSVEWLVKQDGRRVAAIGDEPRVARQGAKPEETGKLWLDRDAKQKLLDALPKPAN
jgi:hypothetical protein